MLSKIRGLFALVQFSITVAIVIFFMYTFRKNTHTVIKIWMRVQIFLLGIKLEEIGKLDETCDLILINHQSLLDIIIIEYIHSRNLAWVAKKEIRDLPFFGHIIKAPRMIYVDRENKAGIIKLMRDVKNRLSFGRPIAMFPEGTRPNGKKMLKFKPGAKIIGNKYELRVQPIIILNTREILDSKKITQKPGTVKVIYLDPVKASKETNWFEKLESNMNEVFNKEMNKNDI